MMTNEIKKETIRARIRHKRSALSKAEREAKNEAIRKRLEINPLFQKARHILTYISTHEEVDTHTLLRNHLGKKTIVVPTVIAGSRELKLVEFKKWNDLGKGLYGILEITDKWAPAYAGALDLILVPGIAFDRQGHRIGYGKGYYDTLLKKYPSIPTLGLAYDLQLIDKIPNESHDTPVKTLLTETETHSFAP